MSMGTSSAGRPSTAMPPPWAMAPMRRPQGVRVPRHLQGHVVALHHGQARRRPRRARVTAGSMASGGAHPDGQLPAEGVGLAHHHVAGAGVAGHGGGHEPDRAGPAHQHVLAQHGEGEGGVDRVAQRVEDGGHVEVDARPSGARRWSWAGPRTRRRRRRGPPPGRRCGRTAPAARPGSGGTARTPRGPRPTPRSPGAKPVTFEPDLLDHARRTRGRPPAAGGRCAGPSRPRRGCGGRCRRCRRRRPG